MFERFTERARQVVQLAHGEAKHLGHPTVTTNHLLFGLIQEGEGLAGRVLQEVGISIDGVRAWVIEQEPTGTIEWTGQVPMSGDCRKVLERSLRKALSLGHSWIGTEHILLGLLEVDDSYFLKQGLDPLEIHTLVVQTLSGEPFSAEPQPDALVAARKIHAGLASIIEAANQVDAGLKMLIATLEVASQKLEPRKDDQPSVEPPPSP